MNYKSISRIFPNNYLKRIEKQMRYADVRMDRDRFIVLNLMYSLGFGLLAAVVATFFFGISLIFSFPFFLMGFFIYHLVFYSALSFLGENRGKYVEEVLPDALQLMASNIRSGLTPDKALLLAARPEFGILEREIKNAAKKTLAGTSLEDALTEISNNINSQILSRTVRLIIEGINKGGELAPLLERTSEEIRHTKVLRREISAQVTTYAIFIFIAAGMGAPLLFGISSHLVQSMVQISSAVDIKEVPTLPRSTATFAPALIKISISPEFIQFYSLIALTIIAIFGGILIGLIKDGSEKAGIKYVPILFVMDIGIFLVVKTLIGGFLGISIGA